MKLATYSLLSFCFYFIFCRRNNCSNCWWSSTCWWHSCKFVYDSQKL